MQRSLFLLVLMGHWSFFSCRLYEYHFIEENKSWDGAVGYCKEHHTDLATVYDMTDVQRLRSLMRNHGEAWIGLRSESGTSNRKWYWSLPGVEFTDSEINWADQKPDENGGNCVKIDDDDGNIEFDNTRCICKNEFICYNETNPPNKRFHLINMKKTWTQAQSYCRERHTDLVSGTKQLQDEEFKNEIRSEEELWIGLFRDTWKWSDGKNSSFRNWDQEFENGVDEQMCAAFRGSGKWHSENCGNMKPFFCYGADNMVLIKESKTWEGALDYCRENYHDLISITSERQQRLIEERAKKASTEHIWLGLRYSCFLDLWFWVNDKMVCSDNWGPAGKEEECGMAGAMERGGGHKWFSKNQNVKFNFVCSTSAFDNPP